MITDRDVADLVRLRHTVAYAQRLAVDHSEWGRHTALVALDGACEYAMRLSLNFCGIPVRREDRFDNLVNSLANGIEAWTVPHRRDIFDMRAARNTAQHGGVVPDATNVMTWRDAVTVFIGSLILAAYGTDLDEVLLASAVQDDELQTAMAVIERR